MIEIDNIKKRGPKKRGRPSREKDVNDILDKICKEFRYFFINSVNQVIPKIKELEDGQPK